MSKYCLRRTGQAARWLAAKAGLIILPPGFSMFSNELAKQVGVERAAIHQKIKGWQEYNQRQHKQSHFRNDRWWTYGSPKWWFDHEFSWSSLPTVRRAFKDLEKAGVMLIDPIGQNWLSAVVGEKINLTPVPVTMKPVSSNLIGGVSKRQPSIGNQSTLKQSKINLELDSKIISDSRERDYQPEGLDLSKFLQDDPYPVLEDVPQYLRQQMPTPAIRQQLACYSQKLGLKTYAEVMARCANAHSWEYVLKALANELANQPAEPPRSAPPPNGGSAPARTWAEIIAERDAADNPPSPDESTQPGETDDDNATPDIDPAEIEAAS